MADSDGRLISKRGTIIDDMDMPISETSFRFELGYSTALTVFLYNNGHLPAPGASSAIVFDYHTLSSETRRASALSLGAYSTMRERLIGANEGDGSFDLVPVGATAAYSCDARDNKSHSTGLSARNAFKPPPTAISGSSIFGED